MKTRERSGLLCAGLLVAALLSGCGSSESKQTNIPAAESFFYAHSVVFGNNSTLLSVGYNAFGQLGNGSIFTPDPIIKPVANLGPVHGFASGANHTLAFTNNSSVWAWGSNFNGRLGVGAAVPTTGTSAYLPLPARVKLGDTVRGVAAGWLHSLALVGTNGFVYSWGGNSLGQLGLGDGIERTVPQQVKDSTDSTGFLQKVKQLAAGGSHSLALKEDGTVWAWGSNSYGQLGSKTTLQYSLAPVQVVIPADPAIPAGPTVPLDRVKQIAAAGSYSLALRDDGTIWAWGYNGYGQLGQSAGVLPSSITPVRVKAADGTNFLADQISAGILHVLALKADRTVWAWGFNGRGQLGDGTTVNSAVPVQAKIGASATQPPVLVREVRAFGNHSLARIGNNVIGWGDNGFGQLGQPISTTTVGFKLQPVLVTVVDNP